MEAGDSTFVEHGVNGLVDGSGVSNMHVFALAVGGTFAFEGPDQAHRFVLVLGDGGVLAFHHDLDAGVSGVAESGEHVSVGLAIEGGQGPTLLARGTGVAGG